VTGGVGSVLTSLLLGLPLKSSVPLNSGNELLSALGVLDVLDSEVDPLLEVSVSDDLEADHSDSSGRDVVDNTGLSVVELVVIVVVAELEEEERRREGKEEGRKGEGEVEVGWVRRRAVRRVGKRGRR